MYGQSGPLKVKVDRVSRASAIEGTLVWSRLTHTKAKP